MLVELIYMLWTIFKTTSNRASKAFSGQKNFHSVASNNIQYKEKVNQLDGVK